MGGFCSSDLLGEYSREKGSGGSRVGWGKPTKTTVKHGWPPSRSRLAMRELASGTQVSQASVEV